MKDKKKHKKKSNGSLYLVTIAQASNYGTVLKSLVMRCDGEYPSISELDDVTDGYNPIVCIQKVVK